MKDDDEEEEEEEVLSGADDSEYEVVGVGQAVTVLEFAGPIQLSSSGVPSQTTVHESALTEDGTWSQSRKSPSPPKTGNAPRVDMFPCTRMPDKKEAAAALMVNALLCRAI